jgi:two-component system cell cycle sensor histidine kinase/response regulator CckA
MGAKRVLIVDDDPAILALTSRVLTKCGYEAVLASGGRQALEIIADGTVIDVVLSDVVMPDIQGPALIEAMRKVAPRMACVLMSAYSPSSLQLPRGVMFLHKPFQSRQLTAAIEESFERRAKSREGLPQTSS